MTATPELTADTWPIATCMHGFASVAADGTRLHDAPPERWDEVFRQVARLGFDAIEIADSHIRPSDLTPTRRAELQSIADSHGVRLLSVHVQRQSVIEPGRGEQNLAYAHQAIDAAAELGMQVFSTGLHQPFNEAQRKAAEASRERYGEALRKAGYGEITTEILDAPDFYYAEAYHQQYLHKNPGGYCGLGGCGVSYAPPEVAVGQEP